MEKVAFIFLLSLSLCLGTPQQGRSYEEIKRREPGNVTMNDAVTTPKSTPAPVPDTKPSGQTTVPVTPVPVTNDTAAATTANPTSTQNSAANTSTEKKKNETSNETSTSTEAATPSPSPKDKSTTTASPSKATNDTATNADNVTTPKNETSTKPTDAPPSHAEDKITVQSRAFDGPSFFGGIILTLGILAIGFMGFKYYRNQTERNYHTL